VKSLGPFKIPIKTLPNLRDVLDGNARLNTIRDLAVEDLLARPPRGLDPLPVKELIEGKRVLVTGGGGSIGSELCLQIAALAPASLTILERYENSLYEIRHTLEGRLDGPIYAVVGDVTDAARVNAVMAEYRPQIVFHAAAHKHVPLMEENPCEAVKNNVKGTRLLAHAAIYHEVDRFVLISTDKAVNPISVMGATKRLAELVVQSLGATSRTTFTTVRFGNVLASNGSVVPRFLQQIHAGGPVTVTHPEMRRYFMLIPEAVQLVLHAAALGGRGSIHVLEMGDQIRIVDMARNLIRLSGFVPDEEISLAFTGMRPGEKLAEELVGADEVAEASSVPGVLSVNPGRLPSRAGFEAWLRELEDAATGDDAKRVLAVLGTLLPGFLRQDAHADDVLTDHQVRTQ
jgi:FlaA1/EpsC-like NDP-sugar epimerase